MLVATIENASDAGVCVRQLVVVSIPSAFGLSDVEATDQMTLEIKTLERVRSVKLAVEVLDAVTAPNTNPEWVLEISPEKGELLPLHPAVK